ncbi:DNA polymerase IV [Crassaminicella profunda]|uniref:DNA polymerase IV n=1 Tax=Crassaminicella profunda TaxID=1286698 RepID=UPI001CA76162|nr:DNA polymerase IV [Crassaminicella profunda]QZY54217.1 DNA polymerase IV [Crassaminicella profunda]
MRNIIHVDLDAFFASVEQRDHPELKGKPVIVGGQSNRGVVCTCSYEARKYGVSSAMPGFMAKKKCPHGIFLPVRMKRYKEVSREVFTIFYEVTDRVEPLSIDEAYLDVTDLDKKPTIIANYIKEEVMKRTGLTLSIGISYNKFLAKLASDWNKPDGLKVIKKEMLPDILKPLPIRAVYGIGKKSAKKLNNIGIFTIEDLLKLPKAYLMDYHGKQGLEIYDRIRGIDYRGVEPRRERKSIGRETTFKEDTQDRDCLREYLKQFSKEISNIMGMKKVLAKTITVKMKTSDFENHTKSRTIHEYIYSSEEIYNIASDILDEVKMNKAIRLIGLTVSNFSDQKTEQLSFL